MISAHWRNNFNADNKVINPHVAFNWDGNYITASFDPNITEEELWAFIEYLQELK